jgi:hypothetical protein
MGEGFIVRKGGVVSGTLAPSLTLVSKTQTEIVFTITNNDPSTADIFWEVGDTTPDANTLSLASATTSSNQTVSGLTQNTEYIIYAFANAADKAGSPTVTLTVTTDELIYTAATGGTTLEYDDGGKRYKSHTFTSNGTFEVTTVGNGDRNLVDYLIIAGGAGGSDSGGGGAGGYRTTLTPTPSDVTPDAKVVVTATSYGVTIGLGGAASANDARGVNGQNTTVAFSPSITSTGGGTGGLFNGDRRGSDGGSGGGGSVNSSTDPREGGNGILGQGRNGGAAGTSGFSGGGGGAAGELGQNGVTDVAGRGGNGLASIIRNGTSETRAGGGGGGHFVSGNNTNIGGLGGGGNGCNGFSGRQSGVANTGSGGGGTYECSGATGAGGSGIVIIRYEIAPTT